MSGDYSQHCSLRSLAKVVFPGFEGATRRTERFLRVSRLRGSLRSKRLSLSPPPPLFLALAVSSMLLSSNKNPTATSPVHPSEKKRNKKDLRAAAPCYATLASRSPRDATLASRSPRAYGTQMPRQSPNIVSKETYHSVKGELQSQDLPPSSLPCNARAKV